MIYVLVRCLQKGQGAPAREPVVSSQEQKEMMAYYYRKQEELKVCLHMGDFTKKIRTTSLTKLMCIKFVSDDSFAIGSSSNPFIMKSLSLL